MGFKSLIGSSVLVLGALATTGCYGKVDKSSGPKVVGSYAELVVKKKEWLHRYDADCQVCFRAFEQCQLGASSEVERSACQPALDACVQGGLINPSDPNGDAGADPAGGDVSGDPGASADPNAGGGDLGSTGDEGSDPGVTQDAGAGDDTGGGFSDGAGSSDDASAGDGTASSDGAGPDGTGSSDGVDSVGGTDDAGVDGAGGNDPTGDASNDDSSKDGSSNDGGNVDPVKKQLIEQVEACLEQAHTCVSADNAVIRECVKSLNGCVRSAIHDAFGGICAGQIGACVAEKASEQALRSVENICQLGLDLTSTD